MPTPTVNFQFRAELRNAAKRSLRRSSDGDTPVIDQPIRMVSIDTPEKKYSGGREVGQEKLDACRARLTDGRYDAVLPQTMRDYLLAKLTGNAAGVHIGAAYEASSRFEQLMDERLLVNEDMVKQLMVKPTGEMIDDYGRLLAYVGPWLDPPLPPPNDPARKTLNLLMLETGWAALFIIYPSLPRNDDFNRSVAAAEAAWDGALGQWAPRTDGEGGRNFLPGYEYRACIKLGEPAAVAARGGQRRRFYTIADLQAERAQLLADGWAITEDSRPPEQVAREAFQRHCVDLRTITVVGRFDYGAVPPPYRMWIWDDDLTEAREALDLP